MFPIHIPNFCVGGGCFSCKFAIKGGSTRPVYLREVYLEPILEGISADEHNASCHRCSWIHYHLLPFPIVSFPLLHEWRAQISINELRCEYLPYTLSLTYASFLYVLFGSSSNSLQSSASPRIASRAIGNYPRTSGGLAGDVKYAQQLVINNLRLWHISTSSFTSRLR